MPTTSKNCFSLLTKTIALLLMSAVVFDGVSVVNSAQVKSADALDKEPVESNVADEKSWIDKAAPNRSYDFGDIQIGTSPTHEFEIKNPTEGPLQIKSIFCSCGCVTATFDEQAFQPGESSTVVVKAKTEKFRGPKTATVSVRFTDSVKEIQFSVVLNIRNLVVEPDVVDFRSMDLGGSGEQTIFISRPNNVDWKISKIETSHDLLNAEIVAREVDDERIEYEILCKLAEAKSDIRSYQELRVSSNDPAQPLINIPIRVGINPPLHVSPAVMLFQPTESATTQKLIVKTKVPTELKQVEVDSDYFSIGEPKPAKKKIHIVEVTCVPIGEIHWEQKNLWATIKVTTDNNLTRTIRLNLRQPDN